MCQVSRESYPFLGISAGKGARYAPLSAHHKAQGEAKVPSDRELIREDLAAIVDYLEQTLVHLRRMVSVVCAEPVVPSLPATGSLDA